MAKADLTAQRLRELLNYDPASGVFTWLMRTSNRVVVGDVAGSHHNAGYVEIGIDGTSYLAHRLAWLWMRGEWPPFGIDHKDRDRSNNRFDNLRVATTKQNQENRCVYKGSVSGITGVTWDAQRERWCAHITHNSRMLNLGRYVGLEDAIRARLAAESRYFTHSTTSAGSSPTPAALHRHAN